MKYELQTWKLKVWDDFDSDEDAIRVLGDRYLRISKCDFPGQSVPELLTNSFTRCDPSKHVFLFVEHEVFGIKQMVQKHQVYIYPSCKYHWWNAEDINIPTTELRYKILENN